MKKIVGLSAFLLSALLTFPLAAQDIQVGVRGGVNWSHVRTTELLGAVTPEFSSIVNPQFAVVAEWNVNDNFSLLAEPGYTRKGFGLKQSVDVPVFGIDLPLGVALETRFNYMDLPLLAKARVGGQQARAYVVAGPAVGYAMDGELLTRTRGLLNLDLTRTNLNLGSLGFERWEISGVVGVGAEVQTSFGKLFVDGRYQHGFTQLYDIPAVTESIRNSAFAVQVGYTLPLGKAPRP
ncbi:MAG: PorT family protein [Lewinellaceae bacterium]|nr:PorT family protein [Lewinellaceae bacterium]